MKLLLGGSLFFSILYSFLLWNTQPGVAVAIFCISLLAFFVYILTKHKKVSNQKGFIFCVPIILLSLTYFLFNNDFFQTMNTFVIGVLWLIFVIDVTKEELAWKSLFIRMFHLVIGPFEYFQAVLNELKKVCLKKESSSKRAEVFKKIIKALICVIPVVLVVIFLLVSADSIFANLFTGMSEIVDNFLDSEELPYVIARIIVMAIVFLYMSSFLYNIIQENTLYNKEKQAEKKGISIESITIQVLLTILNIIYLIFCTIQILYLFTRAEMPNHFDYADYARQGFFQLMFVSLINFVLLYVIHSNKKESSNFQKKYITGMELGMELFTQIIVISAFYRMFLYEQTYGYTYLRLFVYFILAAEFLFMLPTIWYTLGKKINLLKVGITIATVLYLILNYINVDALIARNNINRYYENQEKNFDFYYLKYYTSTDAIPEIMRLLDTEDITLKEQVTKYLRAEKEGLQEKESWQEYNLSKQRARACLEEIK